LFFTAPADVARLFKAGLDDPRAEANSQRSQYGEKLAEFQR